MRTLVVATIIASLATPAAAQAMGGGKHHRGDAQKTQGQTKKSDDKDYKATLKRIPDADKKADPWGTLR